MHPNVSVRAASNERVAESDMTAAAKWRCSSATQRRMCAYGHGGKEEMGDCMQPRMCACGREKARPKEIVCSEGCTPAGTGERRKLRRGARGKGKPKGEGETQGGRGNPRGNVCRPDVYACGRQEGGEGAKEERGSVCSEECTHGG
eukprot:30220-Chlamydomonas_euryale.AAC.2